MLFVSENRSNAHRENPYSLNPVNILINPGCFWQEDENSNELVEMEGDKEICQSSLPLIITR
jgi:hypothetical protein